MTHEQTDAQADAIIHEGQNNVIGNDEKTNLPGEDIGLEDGTAPRPLIRQEAEEPPDGGYGWVCVACVFLINGHTWGVNSSYGIFLAYYLSHDYYPGATALQYGFVGSLSISIALCVSPLATITTGRYGTRTTLAIGIVLETAALLGASWAHRIWQLFLSQGVCFGMGMGFLFVGSVGIIPQWFTKRRSFANSIGTSGSGIGALMYSLATNAMIQSIGLGWAFRILAILSFSVNSICTILIRDRNEAVGARQVPLDRKLFQRVEYWLLLGWGTFSILGYIILLFSLPDYASSIGLNASQGSIVGAMLNLGQGIGRPLIGYFSDTVGRINIALLSTFLAGLFCLVIWIFATSYGVLIFFALVGGCVAGTLWAVVAPVGAEVHGLRALPAALSMLWMILVVPATFAEPIGLELRITTETSGRYLHAQIFTGFMYMAAALCMWFIRAWKVKELLLAHETAASSGVSWDGEKREVELRNDDAVPRRRASDPMSLKKKPNAWRGLWALVRV
ncbi:MAG: hypothetical protein M1818_007516 [Claussenomyces sp. TS43310]|nr:MAG: hypothetical protein M1818_007516 [Claussenomyces sp. TS43310]